MAHMSCFSHHISDTKWVGFFYTNNQFSNSQDTEWMDVCILTELNSDPLPGAAPDPTASRLSSKSTPTSDLFSSTQFC